MTDDEVRAMAERWVGVKGDQAGGSTLATLSEAVLDLLDRNQRLQDTLELHNRDDAVIMTIEHYNSELAETRSAALEEAADRAKLALTAHYTDDGWHAILMTDDGGVDPGPLHEAYLEAIRAAIRDLPSQPRDIINDADEKFMAAMEDLTNPEKQP